MGDRDEEAPSARELGGVGNAPRRSRADAGARRRRDVDAGVEAAAAGPESVRYDAGHRPGQREGQAPRRSSKLIERVSPGDAVGAEARGALEPPQGALGARAELAVDRPAREPVLGEGELERDDIRPRQAGTEGARPERAKSQRAAG